MLGFWVAGLALPEGVHSDFGLEFLILGIGLDLLIVWLVAMLLIETLMFVVRRGMKTE